MRIGLAILVFLGMIVLPSAHAEPANDAQSDNTTKVASVNTQPYSPDAIKHYNRGVELHQAGFLNQAITEYKDAIEADNRMEEAFSNLGVIYAAQRNYPRAKEAFCEALKLKPNRPTTLNGLGTVLYAQGQIDEATEKWKEALAADPRFASAYYNMGNAYEGEKNLLQAKTCYMKAIVVMPNMADAYFRLGNIMNKEHHYPQAEVLLKKAIELDPEGEFVREAKHSLYFIETHLEKGKLKTSQIHKAKNNEHGQSEK
jgi:tetratricopeptide (TPR) repeat protein